MHYIDSKELGNKLNYSLQRKKMQYFCFFLGILLFAVGFVPYAVAINQQDSQHSFNGYLHYPEDMDTYAAFVNQSKNGAWLFYNPYDIKGSKPAYFNLLWMILGKITALGVSFSVVFQLLRLVSCILLVIAFGALLEKFELPNTLFVIATLLFTFGSGFGWLVRYLTHSILPPDTYTELFPFVQATFVPHSALAHAFLLFALCCFFTSEKENSLKAAVITGVLMLALGFFRAYDLLVVWSVCAAVLFVRIIIAGERINRIIRALAILAIPAPAFLYSWWLTSYSDGFSVWSRTNYYFPPGILTFSLALGLPLLIAFIWAVVSLIRFRSIGFKELFLFIWAAVAFGLMYSGVLPFAWRTCAAFITPLVIAGTMLLKSEFFNNQFSKFAIVFLLLFAMVGSFSFLKEKIDKANEQYRYYFRSPEEVQALKWLNGVERKTRVLTHGHVGLKVPAYSSCISFLGHKDLTESFNEKQMLYGNLGSTDRRRSIRKIFEDYQIDLLFWGPLDRRFATKFDPAKMPKDFVAVYKNPLVTIYEFTGR